MTAHYGWSSSPHRARVTVGGNADGGQGSLCVKLTDGDLESLSVTLTVRGSSSLCVSFTLSVPSSLSVATRYVVLDHLERSRGA